MAPPTCRKIVPIVAEPPPFGQSAEMQVSVQMWAPLGSTPL
jgi:hypothetical protein